VTSGDPESRDCDLPLSSASCDYRVIYSVDDHWLAVLVFAVGTIPTCMT
jgi:hypothetical protein